MSSNRQSRSYGHLGEGPTALAKLSLIIGVSSIFLVMIAGALPPSAKDSVYWIQRIIVAAAILALLGIFFRHPLPSRRPEGLTEVFIYSPGLFLAAWVTGVWAGVFAAPLIPLLALGSWITERLRRD
ncbi:MULTISPECIES: hypothetical protein [unclassified Streptomyces]|uniref:hypothetical protein n=1 Tax=unclassified Streptomyces TaxID=2593676 RepID=UPI0018EE7629|nr:MULTISPECIES: hypothetical protein [unclassified Streptomyces]MBJ6644512.1 hypothetical protein [Streptomyces sp. BSE7-9]